MSEVEQFYDLEPVAPTLTDGLLLARERLPKITTIGQLLMLAGGAISFSQTPPETGHLWGQLDGDGNLIEQWQRRGELWLSLATYEATAYRGRITGSQTRTAALPCPGQKLWIESFSYRCVPEADFGANESVDFQLRLVNQARQQSVVWYLPLSGAQRNQAAQASEKVGLVFDSPDAIAVWFRVQRSGGTTGLRYCSLSASLRKVYAST